MNSKDKLQEILGKEKAVEYVQLNVEHLIELIPEIKPMIGFEHKHPHHYLDVWNHTLEVIRNLNTMDFELNMAALLHDIGKPFSYQDGEIRHFHGHPEVSAQISQDVLKRLEFDETFVNNVVYLVRTHDTVIDPENLDNTPEMIQKRLQLQYADAKAHKPDKIEKRIKFLDDINIKLANEMKKEGR